MAKYESVNEEVKSPDASRRNGLLISLVLLFLVVCGAVAVVVILLMRDQACPVNTSRERFVGTVTLNRTWDRELADSSSAAYESLESDICRGLTDAIHQETHRCEITSFRQGSIQGSFVTSVSVSSVSDVKTVISRYHEHVRVNGEAAEVVAYYDLTDPEGGSPGNDRNESTDTRELVRADGAYTVSWTSDADTLTLHIMGRTRGWVGFGVSGTGGMKNADIMVAWVDDSGVGHILDTYANENGAPVVDSVSQDWKLLEASEDDEYTRVTVRRYLQLCDPDNRNITSGTQHLIWAFGASDPVSVTSLSSADYHSNNRGSASRRLLDPAGPPADLPQDAFSIEITLDEFHVPAVETTYHCLSFELPELPNKNHLIMVEPILDEGNELIVHHAVLYGCDADLPEQYLTPDGFACYASTYLDRQQHCTGIIAAWAVGGEDLYYPQHVGLPVGGPDTYGYIMIEMHYDNPHLREGTVDSSGLRMWLTPSLRQYDAGLLGAGFITNKLLSIPPRVENFAASGHCSEGCLRKGLNDMPDGVHAFGGFLHTHLVGVSVLIRHIRNGTELPPIVQDMSYDFDFQNVIFFDEEITILAGDRLIVECGYSTGDRDTVTHGGFSTEEEMCLAFLYYYPQMAVSQCLTMPTPAQTVSFIEGAQLAFNQTNWQYYFTSPQQYAGQNMFEVLDDILMSDPSAAAKLQEVINDAAITEYCEFDGKFTYGDTTVPSVEVPYIETPKECHSD